MTYFALCSLLHITKTRTTPYRPCSNGQVERINRSVLQMVRSFLQNDQTVWDLKVPQLAGAIRATVNRSTGFTPNMMMLGREVISPADIIFNVEPSTEPQHAAPYVQMLRKQIEDAHLAARKTLSVTQSYQKKTYDLKLYQAKYELGDLVLIRLVANKTGLSSKLCPVWHGPFLVTKVLSSTLYRVRDQRRNFVIHHDRMKICKDRTVPMWARRRRSELLSALDEESTEADAPTQREVPNSSGAGEPDRSDTNDEQPLDSELDVPDSPDTDEAEEEPLRDIRYLFGDVPSGGQDHRKEEGVQRPTRAGRVPCRPGHLKNFV